MKRNLFFALLVFLVFAFPVAAAGGGVVRRAPGPLAVTGPQDYVGPAPDALEYEAQAVYLTNLEREKGGVPPLKSVEILHGIARQHSLDMARQNYFGHENPDGTPFWTRFDRAGYAPWTAEGENIAAGYSTPQSVVNGWMNSPGHRKNILSPDYCEIGVGYVLDRHDTYGPYYHYWTQDFGCRSTVKPVIIEDEMPLVRTNTVHLYVYGGGWAEKMIVSNRPDFAGARWQPYRSRLTWALNPAGNGKKFVYVKLLGRDGSVVLSQDSVWVVYDMAHMPFHTFIPTG